MRIVLFSLKFILILYSCGIETAKPGQKSEVIIASNFLSQRDIRFYKGFEKKTNIKVKIIFLSTDSIKNHIIKNGYNSDFDLIFVKSLMDVKKLNNIKNHEFKFNYAKKHLNIFKPFLKNHWLIAGIDPYVFSYFPDSTKRPTSYVELTKEYLWATPEESELNVFISHVKYHLRKSKKNAFKKWQDDFYRNNVEFNMGSDSSSSRQFIMVKASRLKADTVLLKSKGRVVYFPNESLNGFYADRYCVALLDQAKNFENATKLLKYIDQYGKIPAHFEIIPINSKKAEGINTLSEETILKNL